ncbi:RdgB/HAM1 family non-canonical purine NTP pyrophosphatase [Prochlorococcus marinus]|uniref:RdgB/HAM1 family non-canonical purine NTP pyrophosphatase n=1 Tax=Prochlorococcus marinus TaxID=1219 RepID=UPI0022B54955|nr:RdgB/HAM1 family non-canonical purine NTP pyrophosphatase [Prochlorococcus marinus]
MNLRTYRDFSKLVIASANDGKINEFKNFLSNFPLVILGQPPDLKVQETGVSFMENARIKALAAASATGEISLADDSGLSVLFLNGAPGIYSSRYAKNDSERIKRLLKELELCDNRSAYFSSALCIASPNNEILVEVEGRCDGVITNLPRGTNGFGYDPVFEVDGTGLTYAEMELNQKEALGHRGRAFKALTPYLKRLLDL